MARPRKPSAILELNGAFDHNPQRRRPNEPKESRPLGEPPGRLPVEIRAFWKEIESIVPAGVLKISDRWAVELAARLMYKAVTGPNIPAILELAKTAEMDVAEIRKLIQSQEIGSAELSTLRSLLSALGMTPADRSKLSVPTEKPKNRFAELAAETRSTTQVQ